jgi:hypothetical protein
MLNCLYQSRVQFKEPIQETSAISSFATQNIKGRSVVRGYDRQAEAAIMDSQFRATLVESAYALDACKSRTIIPAAPKLSCHTFISTQKGLTVLPGFCNE